MLSNGAEQQMPQQQLSQEFTAEDVHRQQRANLALRALDLEVENVLLQQENQKLKVRIEELESLPAGKQRVHPVTTISDA